MNSTKIKKVNILHDGVNLLAYIEQDGCEPTMILWASEHLRKRIIELSDENTLFYDERIFGRDEKRVLITVNEEGV